MLRLSKKKLINLIKENLKINEAPLGDMFDPIIAPSEKTKSPFGQEIDVSDSALPPEIQGGNVPVEKRKRGLNKMFKSDKYAAKARVFFKHAVDKDNHIFMLPFLGNEYQIADLVHGKEKGFHRKAHDVVYSASTSKAERDAGREASKEVPGIPGIGGGLGDRAIAHELTRGLLENLGLSQEQIQKIESTGGGLKTNTLFSPITTSAAKVFTASPWMSMHSLFDGLYPFDGLYSPGVTSPIMDYIDKQHPRYSGEGMQSVGNIIYDSLGEDIYSIGKSGSFRYARDKLTKGLDPVLGDNDVGPELMVQTLRKGGDLKQATNDLLNILYQYNIIKEKLNPKQMNMLAGFAEAFRQEALLFRKAIKGKFIMVTVF